jgi:hypothetical protein
MVGDKILGLRKIRLSQRTIGIDGTNVGCSIELNVITSQYE